MGLVELVLAQLERDLTRKGLTWEQSFPILVSFLAKAEAIVRSPNSGTH
jgi:hypothetical protein